MRTVVGIAWLLVAGAFASACGEPATEACGDGSFCPDGTVCGASDRCVVKAGECAGFGENAPCLDEGGGAAFCVAGQCTAAVDVIGQVIQLNGDDVVGATVAGLERPWMDLVDVAVGAYVVPAIPFDVGLVLRFEAGGLTPMLTRPLTLGDTDFIINEDPNEPLRMIGDGGQLKFVTQINETFTPSNGLLSVRVTDGNGGKLRRATAALIGPGPSPRALYFTSSPDGDPLQTETSVQSSQVVFPNVVPGTYELQIDHPQERVCRATGDAEAVPIAAVLEAGALTNIGTVDCALVP